MKLFKYIIISILLHLTVLSLILFKRGSDVSLGIRGGEVALYIGSGDSKRGSGFSSAVKSRDDIRSRLEKRKSGKSGVDNDEGGDSGGGGVYGAVRRLVAEAYRNNPPE